MVPVSAWLSQSSLSPFNLKADHYIQLLFYLPNPSSFPSVHKLQNILPHWSEFRNYCGYCLRAGKIINGDFVLLTTDCYSLSPVFHLPCNLPIQSAFLQFGWLDTCGDCVKVEVNDIHHFPLVCKASNTVTYRRQQGWSDTVWPW